MADIRIEVTSVEVAEENAADFKATYEALAKLPNTRKAVADFADAAEARTWAKQGRAWAEQNGLVFARKGDVKNNPARVEFRIYAPKTSGETSAGDAEE